MNGVAGWLVVMIVSTLMAAPALEQAEPMVIDERLDQAIDRGLAGLVSLQAEDGSFGRGAAISALSGMALLAGGHTPERGAYHEASRRVLAHILSLQDPLTGYIDGGFGHMYSHGFATLYLAECYGTTTDPSVRRGLERALDLIYRSQNAEGGWRYDPVPNEADVSVTISMVMALRAAHNAGIGGERSQQAVQRAIGYVRRCALPDGSFAYMPGHRSRGGPEAVPRTAAGVMTLIGAGITNPRADPVLGNGLAFLRQHALSHLKGDGAGAWYWYGQYYTAQAMFHSPALEDWQRYWAAARDVILDFQGPDGVWLRPDAYGAEFATAMALVILQIPNHYLPIFQR